MPESAVNHVVEKLNERSEHGTQSRPHIAEALEIVEAVVLALVAVATAWSGYRRRDGTLIARNAMQNRQR